MKKITSSQEHSESLEGELFFRDKIKQKINLIASLLLCKLRL